MESNFNLLFENGTKIYTCTDYINFSVPTEIKGNFEIKIKILNHDKHDGLNKYFCLGVTSTMRTDNWMDDGSGEEALGFCTNGVYSFNGRPTDEQLKHANEGDILTFKRVNNTLSFALNDDWRTSTYEVTSPSFYLSFTLKENQQVEIIN